MENARIARRAAADIALWYLPAGLFMALYLGQHSAPTAAAVPHFLLLGLPFCALILVRIGLARLIRRESWWRCTASLVMASAFAALFLYYALVIVGLRSWGGVVAWNVIPTFFAQAPNVVAAAGISMLLAAGVLAMLAAGLLGGCWLYLSRFDWTYGLARRVSGWTCAVLLVSGPLILTALAYEFSVDPWTRVSEPISLTLFPEASAQELEGHSIDRVAAQNRDRLEDVARGAYTPIETADRANVVLIVVDALRSDHMSVYGYPRNTTPNLAQLAGQGSMRIVQDARSVCGDTICGLLSLVSSKFPRQFSFRPFTLQEALRRQGYRIHLILSGDHTHFYSLKNYYGEVDTFYDGTNAQRDGYFINDDQFLIDRTASMPDWDGTPAMFQFHLMSTHILRKRADTPGAFQPASSYILKVRKARDIGPGRVTDEGAVNFYDNGVLEADRVIHDILATLARKGYLQRALVVVTGDHGESLGEHGMFSHANSVREELLRVPLLFISYGYRPQDLDATRSLASHIDVAPTVLTELGLPLPQSWQGQPLQQPERSSFLFIEQSTFMGLIDSRDPLRRWKYWIDTSSGSEHVFDLASDPAEEHDLLAQIPSALRGEWKVRALSGVPLIPSRATNLVHTEPMPRE